MKTSNSRFPWRLISISASILALVILSVFGGHWNFSKSQIDKQDESSEMLVSSAPIARNKIPNSIKVSSNSTPSAGASISRKTAQSTEPDSLDQFLKSLDPKADWRVNRADSGRVTAISGALIKGHSDSPEEPEGLLKFAQQIAELTGVPGHQLAVSATVLEDTPETTGRQFDQEVEGYKVFGGYMKIFSRKSDGAIYYIANETRDVGEVDLRIKYTGPEASQIALRAYHEKQGVVVESLATKPVIYPDQALRQGELAWEVILLIKGPLFDRRDLLISARSGQILKDVTLVVH